MRVTAKDVQNLVNKINRLKGFENVSYNTIGALQLYRDGIGFAVDVIMNSSGGVKRIIGGGLTTKESYYYLHGLLNALESEV